MQQLAGQPNTFVVCVPGLHSSDQTTRKMAQMLAGTIGGECLLTTGQHEHDSLENLVYLCSEMGCLLLPLCQSLIHSKNTLCSGCMPCPSAGLSSAVVFMVHPSSEPSPNKLNLLIPPLAAGCHCLVAINGPTRVQLRTAGAYHLGHVHLTSCQGHAVISDHRLLLDSVSTVNLHCLYALLTSSFECMREITDLP